MGRIVRSDYREAAIRGVSGDVAEELDHALDYYDGTDDRDRDILENAVIRRYATAIRRVPSADGSPTEAYTIPDARDAIQRGRHELVLTRLSKKISNSRGTMFTEAENQFLFVDASGERREDLELAIGDMRDRGNFLRTMIRADRVAACLGSCVVYVYWQDGQLQYQAVPPQCVFPLFGDTISVEGDSRRIDLSSISDASAWVLRLGGPRAPIAEYGNELSSAARSSEAANTGGSQYVAYVGASERFPMGRCVTYSAEQPDDIPEPGAQGAWDFIWNGDVANPLTVLHSSNPELAPHEYPIAIINGSDSGSDSSLLPVTGISLFHDALEIDMAWSRLALSSIKSARGVYAITNELNQPYPPTISEGDVALQNGQTISTHGVPASNSRDAGEVIRTVQRTIAEAYNVPGHEVATDGATAPESGVAVYLRSQPKIRDRDERIALNRAAVARVWALERTLLALNGVSISEQAEQLWSPGTLRLPQTITESIESTNLALQAGYIDYIEALRRVHELDTVDDAISLYEQLKQRSAEYPPLRASSGQSPRDEAINRIRERRAQRSGATQQGEQPGGDQSDASSGVRGKQQAGD